MLLRGPCSCAVRCIRIRSCSSPLTRHVASTHPLTATQGTAISLAWAVCGGGRSRVQRESIPEKWYQKFTGRSIKGVSLEQQNELGDTYARHFREYSDGREASHATQKQRTDTDLLSMPQARSLPISACLAVRYDRVRTGCRMWRLPTLLGQRVQAVLCHR